MAGKRERKRVFSKLRNKYRLLLINDRTFEERFSIRLSRMNVILLALGLFTLHGLFVLAVIVFTPLKEMIPGYSDQRTKENAYRATLEADSLGEVMAMRDRYINDLRAVLRGDVPADSALLFRPIDAKPMAEDMRPSVSDSLMRVRIAEEEAYSVGAGQVLSNEQRQIAGLYFFPPLRGVVTSTFDRTEGHYGIDIVTKADEAVKAVLPGTVTLASWTTDGGYVMQVQHANDLVSVYKHNSVLLKKVGDRVRAGEAIAIVGNSGELTSGPHLHFELWFQGDPVDPQTYMVFK
jgi:murein DD-endopeptidase MepM/ murein hydrolase activator NlpD